MSIAARSDREILAAFVAKAGKRSAESLARELTVSPQSIRTWREAVAAGDSIGLRAHVRDKLVAFVEGVPPTAPSVADLLLAHQRDLSDLAREYTRRIVAAVSANIDASLAESAPSPQDEAALAGADAAASRSAAAAPPPAVRRRAKG